MAQVTRAVTEKEKKMDLSILPRWQGPVRVRVNGIGPLGLLFVNKRIHGELLSTIYSQSGTIQLGGYILQHPDDSLSRWKLIYPLLTHPYMLRYMTTVKIKLPTIRADLQRLHDSMRGFSVSGFRSAKISPQPKFETIMSVVPELIGCLEKFERLVNLQITIVAEKGDPPNFEPLLPLYDICGTKTTVVFVDITGSSGGNLSIFLPRPTDNWDIAWKDCLIQNGRYRDCNFE